MPRRRPDSLRASRQDRRRFEHRLCRLGARRAARPHLRDGAIVSGHLPSYTRVTAVLLNNELKRSSSA
jgi:hypothetical protein